MACGGRDPDVPSHVLKLGFFVLAGIGLAAALRASRLLKCRSDETSGPSG